MIFSKDIKNLKIYKRQMFLPTNEDSATPDKKNRAAIFLLTPNRKSSLALMNNPLTINKLRFQSYYIEKDLTYFINSKYMKQEELDESYIYESDNSSDNQYLIYSGYAADVEVLKKIFDEEDYENVLKDIHAETKPILKLVVGNFPSTDEYFEFHTTEFEGTLTVTVHVPRCSGQGYEEYAKRILNFVYKAVYIALYPDQYSTANPSIVADTFTDADTKYNGIPINSIKNEVYEATAITMDNITRKFKYASTTKFKKQRSQKLNTLKRQLEKVNGSFVTKLNIPTVGAASPMATKHESVISLENEFNVKDSFAWLTEGVDYIKLNDDKVIFTNEASYDKYDAQLKKLLYNDRIRQRKDILDMDKQIKADCPFIKYAFPDLDKYNKKNLFVDLYYYNQSFFKNNTWKALKGFNLYLDFLDRLVNDSRIKDAGYTKKTIFIPILDWTRNPNTKMWLYREDINPISIIYQLMLTDSSKLKSVFGDNDIFFFDGKSRYFKLNFSLFKDSQEIKKASMKFRMFISKIIKNESFEIEDVDVEMKDSKEAIKADIYDKIESSKGIDLTGKEKLAAKDAKAMGYDSEMIVKTDVAAELSRTKANVPTAAAIEVKQQSKILTKTADVNKQLAREEQLQKLAAKIDRITNDSGSTEEVLDSMENDEEIKKMLLNLDSLSKDTVDISDARAARINNINDEFLNKQVKDKSVKELLNANQDTKPIPKTTLPIKSPTNNWENLTYINFDKNYNLDADIVACFEHFAHVSRPYAIRNMSIEDTSNSEDSIETYTVDIEDYRGKRQKLKLDIPIMKDNRMMLRGNSKVLSTQFLNMPILKTDTDASQIITNYEKIYIYTFRTSLGRSNPIASRVIKALQKYNGKGLNIVFGENDRVCNKYKLPIDYIDISSVINSIDIKASGIKIYFNQDDIRKDYPDISDAKGVPYAIDTKKKEVLYYNDMKSTMFAQVLVNQLAVDEKFMEIYSEQKPTISGTYAQASILSAKMPLIVIAGYIDGLDNVLKKANIEYHYIEKLPMDIRRDPAYDFIKFKDGYIYYRITYLSSLIMNGLKDCDTESYSMGDMNSRSTYLEFLDNFGGRLKADGIENFNDCLIDPISKEILEYYKLPTTFVECLIYAAGLMADNSYIKHTDVTGRRIRRAELIAAYTYEALSQAYNLWANQLRHGRNNATIVLKQSAVIDKILASPISQDDSVNNALGAIEETNNIAYKGKSGLNSDRSYSLDKRTFDDSMLNVMGASTVYSGNAGITRQATMNMNVEGVRGFVKQIDSDTEQMNTANTLTATESLIPFEVTNDDNPRVLMSFLQTAKHQVRVTKSDPLLITSGTDEAIPYFTTNVFATKAEYNGKVIAVDDEKIIIEYTNGTKDYIDLSKQIKKNSDGGYNVPLQLVKADKIKVGYSFKAGEILAYDPESFSNSLGESDNIAYNVGTLAKVAILNSDDGFEDSGICTQKLSDQLTTQVIYKFEHVIEKGANIYKYAKVGEEVNVGDPLIVWQNPFEDSAANAALRVMKTDDTSELGRRSIKSETTGTIVGLKVFRTCEIDDEMSDSVKKFVQEYERPIKKLRKELEEQGIDTKSLPATYALPTTGKLKKAADAIYVEYYVQHPDIPGVGDKISYFAANKATLHANIPVGLEPYTDFRPDEEVSAMLSVASINHRMVTSIMMNGAINKLMIELDRSVKDMLGIKYDVKNI